MTAEPPQLLKVVIVGAGIGGLTCAIAYRQQGINVTILKRAQGFRPIGANIHLPANTTRAMRELGLYEKLRDHGAIVVQNHVMRAYDSGQVLARKPAGPAMTKLYGSEWVVIHRAQYHSLLLDEATRIGVEVQMDAEVADLEAGSPNAKVKLRSGRSVAGDIVIGRDGLWSEMRRVGLHDKTVPSETGDLAYRGTFSAKQLGGMQDEGVEELLRAHDVQV